METMTSQPEHKINKFKLMQFAKKHLFKEFEDDSEDIVQNTMMIAHSKHEDFNGHSDYSTWVFGIAKYLIWNHNDKSKKNREIVESLDVILDDPESEKHFAQESRHQPESVYETNEKMSTIHQCLNKLPTSQQEVFTMLAEGFDEEEISIELQIPLGTVKSRIHRGRKALRELYSECKV